MIIIIYIYIYIICIISIIIYIIIIYTITDWPVFQQNIIISQGQSSIISALSTGNSRRKVTLKPIDESWIKRMMNFEFKMMNSVLKMMDFCIKMMILPKLDEALRQALSMQQREDCRAELCRSGAFWYFKKTMLLSVQSSLFIIKSWVFNLKPTSPWERQERQCGQAA